MNQIETKRRLSDLTELEKKLITQCLKNKVILHEDYVEIICKKDERVLMDYENIHLVRSLTVNVSHTGYARIGTSDKEYRLHKLIMNTPIGMTIDHINMNKLDNRKSNLRICTNAQNMFNRYGKLIYPTKSGKFVAKIQRHGKKHSKTCTTIEECELFIASIKEGDSYGQ